METKTDFKNTQSGQSNHQKKEIETVLDAFTRAMEEHDVKEIISSYGPNPEMFTLAPPLRNRAESSESGIEAIQQWLDTWKEGPHFESRERRIYVDGNLALVHGLTRMTGKRASGQTTDMWYRETTGLLQKNGKWNIIHQHESVPFYMDENFKAAIDLTP